MHLLFRITFNLIKLEIKNENGARIAEMAFTQIQTKVLNKDLIPCKDKKVSRII